MNKKIFELGKDCYWNGGVGQYIIKENNKYTATVAMQENYVVKLKLDKQGAIIWEECDCSCLILQRSKTNVPLLPSNKKGVTAEIYFYTKWSKRQKCRHRLKSAR